MAKEKREWTDADITAMLQNTVDELAARREEMVGEFADLTADTKWLDEFEDVVLKLHAWRQALGGHGPSDET